MEKQLNKQLVYIRSLHNVVEINVLALDTIAKFKHQPKVILMLGVSDIFNIVHRVSQKVVLSGTSEHNVKNDVVVILNEIIQAIIETAIANELVEVKVSEIVLDSLTEFDLNFLKEAGLNPDSLKEETK